MTNKLCCPKCGNEQLIPVKNKAKTTWMCPHCQNMFRDLDELRKEAKSLTTGSLIFGFFSLPLSIAFILVLSYYLYLDLHPWRIYIPSDIKHIMYFALISISGLAVYIAVAIIGNVIKGSKLNSQIETLENQITMQKIIKIKKSSNSTES